VAAGGTSASRSKESMCAVNWAKRYSWGGRATWVSEARVKSCCWSRFPGSRVLVLQSVRPQARKGMYVLRSSPYRKNTRTLLTIWISDARVKPLQKVAVPTTLPLRPFPSVLFVRLTPFPIESAVAHAGFKSRSHRLQNFTHPISALPSSPPPALSSSLSWTFPYSIAQLLHNSCFLSLLLTSSQPLDSPLPPKQTLRPTLSGRSQSSGRAYAPKTAELIGL